MVEVEAVAAIASVTPNPQRPFVRVDLACLPVVRAFLWDRPWARHFTRGELLRIVGHPLPPDEERAPSRAALALHADGVYCEATAPTAIRWRADAMIDELVLKPRGALVTVSVQTPHGYLQLDCEATRPAARELAAHPGGVLALSGDVGVRGSAAIYRIRTVSPAPTARASSEEVSHEHSAPEVAVR